MSYFIFAGDMLVMLFMVILVTWVFFKSSDETVDNSAKIPLWDEEGEELLKQKKGGHNHG